MQDSLLWKKFILLPTLLFVQPANNMCDTIDKRINKLLNNEWDFTVGQFRHREIFQTQRNARNNRNEIYNNKFTNQQHRVYQHIQKGNLSSAFRILCSDPNPTPATQENFNTLKSKHVQPIDFPNFPTNAEYQQVLNYQPDLQHCVLHLDIASIVFTQKELIAHGYDKLRYEHLKALLGSRRDKEADETEFGEQLAQIITLIINGKVPQEIHVLFADCEVIAGEKCRPIAPSTVYRKIAGFCLLQDIHKKTKKHFQGLQESMNKNGIENIVNLFKLNLEVHPEQDTFAMDAVNAFNSCNRKLALVTILKEFPEALTFARFLYGEASKVWYHGLHEGTQSIDLQEGFQQGDPIATWCYNVAIQPLVQSMQQLQGQQGFTKFFVDDGNIAGNFDSNVQVIQLLLAQGPQYGYNLHLGKGTYLLGKCVNNEQAQQRKQALIDLGFQETIIQIHPDNVPIEQQQEAKMKYGAKILGTYIGTNEYITANLQNESTELKHGKQQLEQFPNLQGRMLLFRYCYCPKIQHLMRTIAPRLLTPLLENFKSMKKDILSTFFESNIESELFDVCCLPYRRGGLSLGDLGDTKHGAFLAGFVTAIESIRRQFPLITNMFHDANTTIPTIKDLQASAGVVCDAQQHLPVENRECFFTKNTILEVRPIKKSDEPQEEDEVIMTIQEQFNLGVIAGIQQAQLIKVKTLPELQWRLSISSYTASCWLDVIPKHSDDVIANDEYTMMLRHRYMLPQPCIPRGLACNCKHHPLLDSRGHHCTTGCQKDGIRQRTHDSFKYTLRQLLNYFGIPNRVEPVGCFQAIDPECNQRPDLSISPTIGLNEKTQIIDLSVVSTLDGVELRNQQHQLQANATLINNNTNNNNHNNNRNNTAVVAVYAFGFPISNTAVCFLFQFISRLLIERFC